MGHGQGYPVAHKYRKYHYAINKMFTQLIPPKSGFSQKLEVPTPHGEDHQEFQTNDILWNKVVINLMLLRYVCCVFGEE